MHTVCEIIYLLPLHHLRIRRIVEMSYISQQRSAITTRVLSQYSVHRLTELGRVFVCPISRTCIGIAERTVSGYAMWNRYSEMHCMHTLQPLITSCFPLFHTGYSSK